MKTCACCKQTKPLADFGIDRKRRDEHAVYCTLCSRAIWRAKNPPKGRPGATIVDGEKICSKCRELKPLDAFGKSTGGRGDKRGICKICTNEYQKLMWRKDIEKTRAQRRKYQQQPNRKIIKRRSDLKKYYGMTISDYEIMLAAQNGVCAICKILPEGCGTIQQKLHVDHCHDTERVRGLLCNNCNNGLGRFKHLPANLHAAIDYLATR